MKALQTFVEFENIKDKISNDLQMMLHYDLEVSEDVYTFNGYDISWDKEDDEEDFQYSEDAWLYAHFDDCEVYLVHSCTGDKYLKVFDIKNKEQWNG